MTLTTYQNLVWVLFCWVYFVWVCSACSVLLVCLLGFPQEDVSRASVTMRLLIQILEEHQNRPPAAASAASAPSTSDTLSVAVAERAGSPWSRTTITSRCRGPSASSSARAVLTSPLYSPTRNGPFPRGSHSS
uniref:Uncharacterized protein n=1 Tax=Aquila chrysaetos chrysaetos TaxID=223781 RepID=A0A663EU07_AQUCH